MPSIATALPASGVPAVGGSPLADNLPRHQIVNCPIARAAAGSDRPARPDPDPNFLEQRAKQFEAAGTAALAGGADATPYFNQSKSFADRAAAIRASGTAVDATGNPSRSPDLARQRQESRLRRRRRENRRKLASN